MSTSSDTRSQIDAMVKSERVVLFMKGNRHAPQCGFSATVVQVLDGLVPEYRTIDVLSDPSIRQGIKDYSNWPTVPQLYIDGEFVGGCDIVREMFASGELQKKLGVDAGPVKPPKITITPAAVGALREAMADGEPEDRLHLAVDARFEHSLSLAPVAPGEIKVDASGLTLYVDSISARRADGTVIDFIQEGDESGFKIDNPNAPPKVKQLSARELKQKLEAGEIREFFDVRTENERARARIDRAKPLDDAAVAYIEGLPKTTPIAFHCHTGRRSEAAAEHFRDKGFVNVFNLAGGITAWSDEVDPKVPKY
jgi:monothiol glutaredoxin